MDKRLLLTGGTGFVGKNLLPYISDINVEVVALTLEEEVPAFKGVDWRACNLLSFSEVTRVVKDLKPTHMLHMAWGMEPSNYNLQSNFDWLDASINLIKVFKENGGERAVMVGSGVEYDWSHVICKEDYTPSSNLTIYGSCKNILRQYSSSYFTSNDISFAWAKLFFLYGPYENELRLVPHIITQLLKGEKAVVKSSELYRDYMCVKDAARCLSSLITSGFDGTINVATGDPLKIEFIAKKIADLIGRPELLFFEKMKSIENKIVFADNAKLKDDFGFKLDYDIETGLLETIDWWREKIKK